MCEFLIDFFEFFLVFAAGLCYKYSSVNGWVVMGVVSMTKIVQIGTIKIYIFANEHNPPHFHITSPEVKATVRIHDLIVVKGDSGHPHVRRAIQWAQENHAIISMAWIQLNH